MRIFATYHCPHVNRRWCPSSPAWTHRDYIDLYKPLLKYDGLITLLSSDTLIKHLLNLNDFSFFEDKETREYIIDILTENIEWFDRLNEGEKAIFYSIPFIETVDSNLYAIDNNNLYLPSDFTPPKHITSLTNKYEVISVEQYTNLYNLYEKMDINKLNIDNYIQEIIIPFLKNVDNILDRKEVLKWLAKEWKNIKEKIDNKTINSLKSSKIIPSLLNEKELFKANQLYIPDIKLPKILNDNNFKPIIFEEESINKGWIEFLSFLGASEKILSTHVVKKVDEICQNEDKNCAIKLLNYIANNFEVFEEMDIFNTLKEYAWFPVEEPKDILKPKNEYSPLKKPNELILKKDLKIAGGYYHLLDNRVKLGKKDEKGEINAYDMAKKFGIVTNIPNEHFFESFRQLIKLQLTNGQVVNYAKEVYKYIGRRFKNIHEIKFDENERTILINNRWIEPKYIFQVKINLSNVDSWNSLVENDTESDLAKGLKLLGVQDKPSYDFLIETLKNLPQKEKLKKIYLNDAKAILRFLQENYEDEIYDDIPILTQQNMLIHSSEVYINDLPAYKNAKVKNEDLYFCHYKFKELASKIGVLSIANNYKRKIYDYKESETSSSITFILEKSYFKEALLRLLYHENKIKEDEINESLLIEVLPSNIIFVSKLIIEYSIEDNFLFRSDETTYEENGELYILNQEEEEDLIEVISKYICNNKKLSTESALWIVRILREQMNNDQIQKLLDKKNVKELPKKLIFEDEPSLFDENANSPISDIESDNEETINKNENYQQTDNISKEAIDPPIKPKVSYKAEREVSTSQKNSKHKKEIQPPLQPKTTNRIIDSTDRIKSNSFNRENYSNKKSSFNLNDNLSSNNKKTISPNDFKPVYVGKEKNRNNKQKTINTNAKAIGDKGENYLLKFAKKFVLNQDNDFFKAPPNNKGYDITEENQYNRVIRYIEVKTLTGQWGQGGVGITKHQLEFAQKNRDKWWLFVIEGIETNNPKVYQFKNPVIEANRFMFDSSWKQLVYQKENIVNQEPKIGDKYEIEISGEQKIAKIINIEGRGTLLKVKMVLENGEKINKRFKKTWRKIDG